MITPKTQMMRDELRQTIADRVTLAAWMETPVTITNREEQIEREYGLELARAHIRGFNRHVETLADRIATDETLADAMHASEVRTQQVAQEL